MPASFWLLEVASTVSTAAFRSVCSESMIPETKNANPPPRLQRQPILVRRRLLHALRAGTRERRLGLIDGDRCVERAGARR